MEKVAGGVHLVRGGVPRVMNVYLIEDEGGVTVFDGGVKSMAGAVQKAAASLGPIKRVVLGHSHADHRGAAPAIAATGVPVFCHEAELADARSDGGYHYFKLAELNFSRGGLPTTHCTRRGMTARSRSREPWPRATKSRAFR